MNLSISRFCINLSLKKLIILFYSIIFKKDNSKKFLLKIQKIFNNKNFILTGQGRNALFFILKNLSNSKKEIIISPYTLPEVINCIFYAGYTPKFIDIDFKTGLLNFNSLKKKINKKTAGVIITHLYSDSKEYLKIKRYLKSKNCKIIEDMAISFGYKYKNKYIGFDSDYLFFSFNLIKNINLFYGGMIYAKNNSDFKKLKKNTSGLINFPTYNLY